MGPKNELEMGRGMVNCSVVEKMGYKYSDKYSNKYNNKY